MKITCSKRWPRAQPSSNLRLFKRKSEIDSPRRAHGLAPGSKHRKVWISLLLNEFFLFFSFFLPIFVSFPSFGLGAQSFIFYYFFILLFFHFTVFLFYCFFILLFFHFAVLLLFFFFFFLISVFLRFCTSSIFLLFPISLFFLSLISPFSFYSPSLSLPAKTRGGQEVKRGEKTKHNETFRYF